MNDPFETTTTNPETNPSALCDQAQDANEKSTEKADGETSFEIPRPLLTMQQAAAFLGKSVRALERSLMGRWGNKLPEGWSAKKVKTDKGEEWRIVPPPGFRVRSHGQAQSEQLNTQVAEQLQMRHPSEFSMEYTMPQRRNGYRQEHSIDQPTIVIDRSEEVEHLLRDLLVTQKALSEERRLHMEDLRIVAQLQGSMRLLESSASESSRAKSDLEITKRELEALKQEYNQMLSLPWWKRLLGFRRG